MEAGREQEWSVTGTENGRETGAADVNKAPGKGRLQAGHLRKLREAPDVYFLKRHSLRFNIGMFSLVTVAGLAAGMWVEDWIARRVEEDAKTAADG
ncbi:hypothetical protein CBR_g25869 [Chara braunii]|uniref:Uncharacterized protein n=1 Tax=Chara braunii TaxID=69332 RepID=A0A388L6N4_CHABU|nr:hypothetical protein CBR_g25869 [Chara braunii]|eukprot:GBG77938.1 hypothetical protein CBR_g25869 [Chara braunii]